MVAALYVDRNGPYPSLPGVDAWFIDGKTDDPRLPMPEEFHVHRDATLYDGPFPVVAHPPCGPWGRLAHLYEGTEQALGLRAVEQVRAFGGVLEHPAGSKLWAAASLPAPGDSPSVDPNGYSIQVEQVSWGHVARKKTWLYLVGVPFEVARAGIRRGGQPTHWASGSRGKSSRKGAPVPPGIKVCSAQQRRRTPIAFAEWLIALARAVS